MCSSRSATLAAVLLSASATADAHLASGQFGDFFGGMLHPLTALLHLLGFLALGIYAGWQENPAAGRAALGAVAGVAIGILLQPVLPAVSSVTTANTAGIALLGLAIAAAWRPPSWLSAVLPAVVGFGHGWENALAATAETDRLLFAAGIAGAAFVTIIPIAALTRWAVARAHWPGIAVRVMGSWLAALGLMVLALQAHA